jgi:seryl-tRNA synthetase
MIPRTELLAVLSDAKAKQDEIQAKVNDLARLERQLSKAQEETNSARQETAQLREEMSRMVRRSDFDSAKALVSSLEAAVAIASQNQREAIATLNLRIGSLEVEKSHCETIMKVTKCTVSITHHSIFEGTDHSFFNDDCQETSWRDTIYLSGYGFAL